MRDSARPPVGPTKPRSVEAGAADAGGDCSAGGPAWRSARRRRAGRGSLTVGRKKTRNLRPTPSRPLRGPSVAAFRRPRAGEQGRSSPPPAPPASLSPVPRFVRQGDAAGKSRSPLTKRARRIPLDLRAKTTANSSLTTKERGWLMAPDWGAPPGIPYQLYAPARVERRSAFPANSLISFANVVPADNSDVCRTSPVAFAYKSRKVGAGLGVRGVCSTILMGSRRAA
jgi:hypothetical protein